MTLEKLSLIILGARLYRLFPRGNETTRPFPRGE